MFNLGSNSRLRGSGHLILNVVRACNIITLLAIAAVSWVMIVMTAIRGTFFFFDAASQFFTSVIAITLILTELSLLEPYFRRTWPVFSPAHGFAWLGAALVVMGCQVLGNLNESAIQPGKIGREIHNLVLATGILSLTFGAANMVATLLFADRKAGINARMIRSDGNLAEASKGDHDYQSSAGSASRSGSVRESDEEKESAPKRWTRRFTLAAGRGLKAKIGHPILQPQDPHHDLESQYPPRSPHSDVRDSRSSPIVPGIKRPDTAMHPLNTRRSVYSEVSYLPRF
ncbi:uncharacterized protein DNG_06133 [Cephalotrichum gorgonifer]|uniref:DUF7598 domain-containing protein n=1 Tax=Cephalotrichum gorgonifer TaxID=2041049 RepID=A0AAE8SW60_9PEZI|nr:uncharacterized protein DNG_06133 [Cephalotrichum gorgonifer]